MARAALQKVYADFRQGFVTVANPLAYPEGSLKDIVNFNIKDNGTLALRQGLKDSSKGHYDYTIPQGVAVEDLAITSFLWKNVNNVGGDQIVVVQIGATLLFFGVEDQDIQLNTLLGTSSLGVDPQGAKIPMAGVAGSGNFFLVHPATAPKIIKRDKNTGVFSLEDIDIKIRDLHLWRGADDEETGLLSSKTLYPMHEYNLRNGGWPTSCLVSREVFPDKGVIRADPVSRFYSVNSKYPSVYYPFLAGKAGGGDDIQEQNAFSPWAFQTDYFGNSLIPLGHFIVSAKEWTRTGNGKTERSGLPSPNKKEVRKYSWRSNPTNTAFYAGRTWFAGAEGYEEESTVVSSGYSSKFALDTSNTIYFSQQIDSDLSKVGLCYQENDPTSEDMNELMPTDGGTLSIKGSGTVLGMESFGNSLIVFSTEGVWAISGVDGGSFKADAYSVNKIANRGPVSSKGIVASDKEIFFAAPEAIYTLRTNEISGFPEAVDITSPLIKDFYVGITNVSKERARVVFDDVERVMYFFYSDELDTSAFTYNKVIVFNKDLGCFYKYEIESSDKRIYDGVGYSRDGVQVDNEVVTLDGVPVTLDGVPVTLKGTKADSTKESMQFLTVDVVGGSLRVTFSSFSDGTTFKDWDNDYTANVEFGFDTAGDIMRDSLKAPVIISHLERTEDGFVVDPNDPTGFSLLPRHPSSCMMYYGWDWSDTYKGGTELYRLNRNYVPYGVSDPFSYGVDVITTRNRIRGKGHSLGLSLEAGRGKDCRILGIGILYTAASRI